jgi:acid phosphatase type 7
MRIRPIRAKLRRPRRALALRHVRTPVVLVAAGLLGLAGGLQAAAPSSSKCPPRNRHCQTTTATTTTPSTTPTTTTSSTTTSTTPTTDPVIVAAGDICASATNCSPTANLIGQINPTRVLTLGDNAYEDGTLSQYQSYYDPNWGKYKSRTSPAPGNHEYHTANAQGYFDYFGSQAPGPYYSFDIGSWHLISLASDAGVNPSGGSAEETWLRNDLAAHATSCILAYWHEPRWSSGAVHGSDGSWDAVWKDLYAAHADVVLNGHDHEYERFAPQNPSGQADSRGIREFVVGTGGNGLYSFSSPLATSEVRNATTYGVIKLTLHSQGYDWQFVPVSGATFQDAGSGSCLN